MVITLGRFLRPSYKPLHLHRHANYTPIPYTSHAQLLSRFHAFLRDRLEFLRSRLVPVLNGLLELVVPPLNGELEFAKRLEVVTGRLLHGELQLANHLLQLQLPDCALGLLGAVVQTGLEIVPKLEDLCFQLFDLV